MTMRRLFWMAVQVAFIAALTANAYFGGPNPPNANEIILIIVAYTVVVAFMTSMITRAYDAIVRRWRGIPAPPREPTPPSTLGRFLEQRRAEKERISPPR